MFSIHLRNRERVWRSNALRVCLFVLALTAFASATRAQEVPVGDTKDGCDGSEPVKFQTKTGQVSVKAGAVKKRFELPAMTNEITWFCGGDRNRSANDKHFNVVRISRAANGAITWRFYKSSASSPSSGPDLVRVGDTKDGCDGSRHVRFDSGSDRVIVKAGESKLVTLSSPRNTLDWFCQLPSGNCAEGENCHESVGNSIAFDSVQIDRAGNGAISWVFYRNRNAAPASGGGDNAAPSFVRNANGDVRVAVSTGFFKTEIPLDRALLKTTLDGVWNERIETIRKEVRAHLQEQGDKAASKLPVNAGFHIESLTIAGTNSTELRTAAKNDVLFVKYLAHGNAAKVNLIGEFNLTFDIELDLALKVVSLSKPPQVLTATQRLGHTEIEGKDFLGNFAQEVFKSKLQNAKTMANNTAQDAREELNNELADKWPKPPKNLPAGLAQAAISVTPAGTVRFCLRTSKAPACQFAAETVAAHSPRLLDSDVDRCGSSNIWLRDAAKGRYVSIAKGKKNVIVEVESREFPWFCGGTLGPESLESAAGPVGTYLLRVSRAPTGDRIDWGFLSWR